MIAHPPCTYLSNSGVQWLCRPGRRANLKEAAAFFRFLLDFDEIPHRAIENPIMSGHAYREVGCYPDQWIEPWEFGDGFQKHTGLWLRTLPKLKPTNIVKGREQACWKESPGEDRGKRRSVTYPGIAAAMAEQWGSINETFYLKG
jgi:hypothetical protein